MSLLRIIPKSLLVSLMFIVACSPKVIKIDQATKESLNRTEQIIVIHYESEDFHVPHHSFGSTLGMVGGAIGGVIGATADVVASNSRSGEIVTKFYLEDPIEQVKEGFVSKFIEDFPNVRVVQQSEALKDDELDELRKKFENQVIFDFLTEKWGIEKAKHGFSTPPAFQTGRNVVYFSRVRLVDLSQEKVLWQGVCDLKDQATFGKDHLDEIVPGRKNFLKTKFSNLAITCIEKLFEQFSGTNTSS